VLAILISGPLPVQAARLKDIAYIEGVRPNQLVGYGVVVGLNGTGDRKGTAFTSQSIANLMERLGVRVNPLDLKLANVAAVVVTADLPPFSRPGVKLDVTLSSVGDATTLQGGVLVMTPLKGADGKTYAVAQGAVSVGGFTVSGGGDQAQRNHTTVGVISRGALVEKDVPFDLFAKGQVKILLREPDFMTATRVQSAVNMFLGSTSAKAHDSGSVVLPLDESKAQDPVELVAQLEQLNVEPDVAAKVVVNERTGTIIMGENVRISTVALAHGNLNITIRQENQVSQPGALAGGNTAVVQNTDIQVGEEAGQLSIVGGSVKLGELVGALNQLGATPRDLIAIFEALQKAGALHAELTIM
jgi:flagellar P-ring protein FlgI